MTTSPAPYNGSGTPFPVSAVVSAPTGGTNCGATGVTCHEVMFTMPEMSLLRHRNTCGQIVLAIPHAAFLLSMNTSCSLLSASIRVEKEEIAI